MLPVPNIPWDEWENRSARGMKNPLVGGRENPTDIMIEGKIEPSSGFH